MNTGALLPERGAGTSLTTVAARAGDRSSAHGEPDAGNSQVRFGGQRRGDHRPKGRHRRLAADPARGRRRRGWLLAHTSESEVRLQVVVDQARSKHTGDSAIAAEEGSRRVTPPDSSRHPRGQGGAPDPRRVRGRGDARLGEKRGFTWLVRLALLFV